MKFSALVLGLILSVLSNTGCNNQAPVVLDKVLSVSDFPLTMKEQQAVYVSFGGDNENYFSMTIHRKDINEGYFFTSTMQSGRNSSSAEILWDDIRYIEPFKQDGFVNFTIEKLDYKDKVAHIVFSALLTSQDDMMDYKSKARTINIPETRIEITGKKFDNLVMEIKE